MLERSMAIPRSYEAAFVVGAVSAQQFPPETQPEVAFMGRSNVGKSSLLNKLLNRRKLARVSRTPGRTREINFFQVGEGWGFVDLPGYGYAKVGRGQRRVWDRAMGEYLDQRRNLRAVVLLLDLRRGLGDMDREVIQHLEGRGIAYLPVAAKIDKLKSNARRQALLALTAQLEQTGQFALLPLVAVSALNGTGIADLRKRLEAILGDAAVAEGDGAPSDLSAEEES